MVDNLCPSCELFNRITPGTTRVEYDHPDHSPIRGNVLEKELHADGTFSEVKIEQPTDIGYMVALCNPAWLRILGGRFDEDDDDLPPDDDDLPPDDDNNIDGNEGGDVDEGGGKSNYSGHSGGEAEGDDNVNEGGNGSDNEGGNGSENEDGSIGGASERGEDASESTISFCMWV